jgi:hypothetical protein
VGDGPSSPYWICMLGTPGFRTGFGMKKMKIRKNVKNQIFDSRTLKIYQIRAANEKI